MKILVSDDTGLTKYVNVEDQKILGVFGEQKKGMLVGALTYIPDNMFVTGHEDSHLRINVLSDPKYTFETALEADSPVVSL
mmetsp:Transcript_491/g.451  ORF Transcript_491/g.451 Transcript_491/m.451 type:complete len:81 (-) Transcript_491:166-408(-)